MPVSAGSRLLQQRLAHRISSSTSSSLGAQGMGRRFASAGAQGAGKLYDLLGVDKNASEKEIKTAYKKMAMMHHPDKGGDAEKFKEISEAYEVLSNPQKKQMYDQFGEEGVNQQASGGPGAGFHDPNDIFEQVFGFRMHGRRGGGGRRGQTKTRDAVQSMTFTLEELFEGCEKKFAYNRQTECVTCKGKGSEKVEPCKRCRGTGMEVRNGGGMGMFMQMTCSACGGAGEHIPKGSECKPCKGRGLVKQREEFTINIPRGTPAGHVVRFAGKADQAPGSLPGDIVILVQEQPHPIFRRPGHADVPRHQADLMMTKKISLAEALVGFSFQVKHLDGTTHTVSNAKDAEVKVVKPGDVWVLRQMGMPRMEGTTRGDLFIQFEVEFPERLADLGEKQRHDLSALLGDKHTGGGGGSLIERLKSLLHSDSKEKVLKPSKCPKSEVDSLTRSMEETEDIEERFRQGFNGGAQEQQACNVQ